MERKRERERWQNGEKIAHETMSKLFLTVVLYTTSACVRYIYLFGIDMGDSQTNGQLWSNGDVLVWNGAVYQ